MSNGLTGGDSSVPGGLIAAATQALPNAALGHFTSHSRKSENLIDGTAVLVGKDRKLLNDALRGHRLGEGDKEKSLREADCAVAEIDRAYLGADGSISIFCADKPLLSV